MPPIDLLFRNGLPDNAQEELEKLKNLLTGLTLNPLSQDDITWTWSESGNYTVRNGYRAMKNNPRILNKASKIWKLDVPDRKSVV